MTPAPSRQWPTLLFIGAVTAVATVYGWKLFFFITDDAFIAFRYVANSLNGRGLVWNPAPFRPVEGYTSFLWVILLREVWRITGVEPPGASNVLSLIFGFGTLLLTAKFTLRMSLPPRLERWRLVFLCLVLAGTLTNRTFLAWLSSGLETACFNFLLTWWVYEGMAPTGRGRPPWILRLSLSAAFCALCRPDGMLAVGATVLMIALERPRPVGVAVTCASPLLFIPAHLLWRKMTYGDWVPNTYRAKYVEAWPESGIRYLTSFAIEYAVWFWLLLILVAAVVAHRRRQGVQLSWSGLGRVLPILVLLAHVAYYSFIIGGDHFEYRVYSQLIPFLFLSAVWAASRIWGSGASGAAAIGGFILLSWPIPWVHWNRTRDLNSVDEAHMLTVPVADAFVPPLRNLAEVFDELQAWLILRHVGMRHQEHKVFAEYQLELYRSRESGLKISWQGRPVAGAFTVGLPGWTLPNVAIIDFYGLNDRVIARHPFVLEAGAVRKMAHSRTPPTGYVECFRPNVHLNADGDMIVEPRAIPLTDDDIRACEAHDWESGPLQ